MRALLITQYDSFEQVADPKIDEVECDAGAAQVQLTNGIVPLAKA